MRSIHEFIKRVREKVDDPRKKELAGLVAQFRKKMEGLLGGSDQISFILEAEQAKKLSGNGSKWERPVTVEIRRGKSDDFRFGISTDMSGEVLELHGNNPRILETSTIGGFSGSIPAGVDPLGQRIRWLTEWIGYAVHLEELQKNSQTVSSAPVTS